MKYLSLFSGIGGFEKGIQQAYVESTNGKKNGKSKKNTKKNGEERKRLVTAPGKNTCAKRGQSDELFDRDDDTGTPACVGYSEIDKYAIQIYENHFGCITHKKQRVQGTGNQERQCGKCTDECTNRFNGNLHKNYGDITKIKTEELPDFDLLVGGFPCQAFSIAGKRRGFEDTRGTLFFEIARILRAKQPRLFLLENVKGLLSHDNGQTFKTIIATLTELGYDLQWQVLNSKNFGVPQNRERVFIVGNIRGTARPEIFSFRESNSKGLEELTNNAQQGYRVYKETGINPTLASQAGGVGAKTGLVAPTIRATCHKKGDNDFLIAHTVRGGGQK